MCRLGLAPFFCLLGLAPGAEGASERHVFIGQAHIRLVSPVHGGKYREFDLIPVEVDVSLEQSWDRALDEAGASLRFEVEVDRARVEPLVVNASYLSASSSPLDVLPMTRAFCVEHGLSDDNQQFLAARVRETVEQLACPLVPDSSAACGEGLGRAVLEQRRVCVAVDDAEPTCSQLSALPPLTVRAPPGPHVVTAWLEGMPGRSVLHRTVSAFTVLPAACTMALRIAQPRHGQHAFSASVPLLFTLHDPPQQEQDNHNQPPGAGPPARSSQEVGQELGRQGFSICFRFQYQDRDGRGVAGDDGEVQCVDASVAGQPLMTAPLRPGRIQVSAWVADPSSKARASPVCPTTMAFQVDPRPQTTTTAPPPPPPQPLTFVTAASQLYYDEERLQNLIGSIHFWEPGSLIEVYSLGLSAEAEADLHTWRHVTLHRLNLTGLPPHVGDWGKYAFKPVVIEEALHRHDRVFWIDANAELRRPMDEVQRAMQESGHFFTTQPYDFPTAQFHHPHTVRALGCEAADLSRQHCSTAFLGFTRGGWAHTEVLGPTLACALEPDCINPPGSHRGNHRQEQTVMNAVMCRLGVSVCRPEMKWRLTSDFENDAHPLQPTADETGWNELVLYTRRNFPVKPYLPHLRRSNDDTPSQPPGLAAL